MKRIVASAFGLLVITGVLMGQGKLNPPGGQDSWRRFPGPYDPKTPPPLALTEAYKLAQEYIGIGTNRFYCVSASCSEPTKRGLAGWTFWFSSTNGERADLEVSFDREVATDSWTREKLRSK